MSFITDGGQLEWSGEWANRDHLPKFRGPQPYKRGPMYIDHEEVNAWLDKNDNFIDDLRLLSGVLTAGRRCDKQKTPVTSKHRK